MFQFTAFPFRNLCIQLRMTELFSAGFPHSDICGSIPICDSPQLFAACHVLLRLPVPRHSPCALSCLTVWYISISRNVVAILHFFSIARCVSIFVWLFFFQSMFSFQGALNSFAVQWRLRDSNSRPPACKAGALPTELNPHRQLYLIFISYSVA